MASPKTSRYASWYRSLLKYTKIGAAIFSVPSAIFSAYVLAQPKISVSVQDHLTKQNTLIVEIKNEGHIPVYDVDVSCGYFDGGSGSFDTNKLKPGKTGSDECGLPEKSDTSQKLDIFVDYTWMFGLFKEKEIFPFKAEVGPDNTTVILRPQGLARR